MKRLLIGLLFLTLGSGGALTAQTVQDFARIYDSYLAAVKSSSYRQVSSFLSAGMLAEINTPEKQADFMGWMKLLAPIRYEAASLTISEDGRHAEVDLSGRCVEGGPTRPLTDSERAELRQNPPQTQGCYLPLKLVKDAGHWKLESTPYMFGEGRPGGMKVAARDSSSP